MAVSVNQVQAQPKIDPMDQLVKGLQIASSVYGIKEANQKAELLTQQATKMQNQEKDDSNGIISPKEAIEYGKNYNFSSEPSPNALNVKMQTGGVLKDIYLTPKPKDADPVLNALRAQQLADLKSKAEDTKLTPAQKAVDQHFAKEYVDWNSSGGFSGVQKQLGGLSDAIQKLQDNPDMTGPGAAMATKLGIRQYTNPDAVRVRQEIEQAVQGTLRQTLGAQFTEKEGERILKNAYDESLPPQANIEKLQATIKELGGLAAAKDASSQYYEQNGTLHGFNPASNRGPMTTQQEAPRKNSTVQISPEEAKNELIRRKGVGSIVPGKGNTN